MNYNYRVDVLPHEEMAITHFDCPALKHNLNISSGFKTTWRRNPKSAQKNGKFQF